MGKSRLEAFSDGVIAVALTIMVLDLKAPPGADLAALAGVLPQFLGYVLSFVFVGIYWSNHHHLLHTVKQVHGGLLWANLHLLFWLTLIPFATAWVSEDHGAAVPTALYGGVLLMAAVAWKALQSVILRHEGGARSTLGRAVGGDLKGNLSLLFYLLALPAAFFQTWISEALYVIVAGMWLVPDRRIEAAVN